MGLITLGLALGAAWFGYCSFWVNRSGAPPECLGQSPQATGADLGAAVDFLLNRV